MNKIQTLMSRQKNKGIEQHEKQQEQKDNKIEFDI